MNVQPPVPRSVHSAVPEAPPPQNGEFGSAGVGALPLGIDVPASLAQLQQYIPRGRKVWPWALLAGVGGAIAGALTGYMVGGTVCRLKRIVGK